MGTRASTPFRPGLRLHVGGRVVFGKAPVFDGDTAFVRVAAALADDASVRAEWTGPGRISLDLRAVKQSAQGPDERRQVMFSIEGVTSAESAHALAHFLAGHLALAEWDEPVSAGAIWSVTLNKPANVESEREFRGPPPRVAGVGATAAAVPPLDTGRPATSIAMLRTWFEESAESKVGMYLNIPTSYSVAGAQYWGRALRLNDRWLQINTSSVLPGLGVRMRADLTTTIHEERRPVSIFGILSRRADAPPGGTFKATLSLRINRIDEGDSPGLLLHYLDHAREVKAARDGAPNE